MQYLGGLASGGRYGEEVANVGATLLAVAYVADAEAVCVFVTKKRAFSAVGFWVGHFFCSYLMTSTIAVSEMLTISKSPSVPFMPSLKFSKAPSRFSA